MPFDDDNSVEAPPPVRKVGVKAMNNKSQHTSLSEIKENFEKQADSKFSKIEDYKTQIWELSVKYKSFIENKVLPENKGPITSNLEKEVLDKLVQLASEMNDDETQPQGIGSTALCMLLMKCM